LYEIKLNKKQQNFFDKKAAIKASLSTNELELYNECWSAVGSALIAGWIQNSDDVIKIVEQFRNKSKSPALFDFMLKQMKHTPAIEKVEQRIADTISTITTTTAHTVKKVVFAAATL